MTYISQVVFTAESKDAAGAYVREYILDVVDRVQAMDGVDNVMYSFGRDEETDERRLVTFTVTGDIEPVIDAEQENWDQHVEDDLITDWERGDDLPREKMDEALGDVPVEVMSDINGLARDIAMLSFEQFDNLGFKLDAVDEFPDAECQAGPIGWWAVMHTATVLLNYSLRDEMAAYMAGIDHTLRNIAEHEDAETAEEELDALIEELEGLREEVKEGRRVTM